MAQQDEPASGDPRRQPRTALVLSGGGMFGAYQAGVWSALSAAGFHPDMVIGASVGSLNGWAIAGGISGEQLIVMWLDPARAAPHRYRIPDSLYGGIIDSSQLEHWIQQLHSTWAPRCPYGVSLTELWQFRPVLVEYPHVEWRHLAASCGVPVFLPQHRIGGRLFADGGLLAALPAWAAPRMGAERVIGVNVLGGRSTGALAAAAQMLRSATGFDHTLPKEIPLLAIDPSRSLGRSSEMLAWSRARTEEWIEMGRADAEAAMRGHRDWFMI